jgi:hypothetical protein
MTHKREDCQYIFHGCDVCNQRDEMAQQLPLDKKRDEMFKDTKDTIREEFEKLSVYTNEYGYVHKIPNYEKLKELIEDLLELLKDNT